MGALNYLKAVVGAVGVTVFPPISDWLVSFVPAPPAVHSSLSMLLVALIMFGAVGAVPNLPKKGT